jgi:hypothetical protein
LLCFEEGDLKLELSELVVELEDAPLIVGELERRDFARGGRFSGGLRRVHCQNDALE